ncbi:ornithine cyclodeaminase family protein [Leucobacter sp. USHLN153]|uniref:ornithine cyclodeaminase family protein n=1 Tax=Leucobacter sp. USHLN153 TaxID=3081268 RepID=UPI0030188C91
MSGASTALPYFSAGDVARLLPLDRAIDAIADALRGDLDPELDGPRLFSDFPGGEFLLMPAQGEPYSGLKALTVAPENPARGLEKIQGLYILYSSETAAPVAVLEGASLTAIRTPAVALAAVRELASPAVSGPGFPRAPRVLVFGAGVQAAAHIRAAALVFPGCSVEIVGRRPERVRALLDELAGATETRGIEMRDRTGDAERAVREADLVLCTTSATEPVFDGALVQDHAIVAATGTHGLERRELDDALVSRADVVVEGRASARRENGNLATAFSEADWSGSAAPRTLSQLLRGEFSRTPGRPAVYTGVGMAWEDLVCATAVLTAGAAESPVGARASESK